MSSCDRYMKGDHSEFAKDMKKLINSKDTSDVKFVIGINRKVLYGHRWILSTRCDVFKAMFAQDVLNHAMPNSAGNRSRTPEAIEVPIVLGEMSIEIFMPMIEYIYTNCVTVTRKNVVDIMGTAVEYGLDGLMDLCIDYMIQSLTTETACESLQAAITYGNNKLRERCMSFIAHNTREVLQSKRFHELSDAALQAVVAHDSLQIGEFELIKSIREWATVNSVVLGKCISDITKSVASKLRLPLLTPSQLKQVETENLVDHMIPVEYFAFAWRHHALSSQPGLMPTYNAVDEHLTRKRKVIRGQEVNSQQLKQL